MKMIFILIFLSLGASYGGQTDDERYYQVFLELIEQVPEIRQLEKEINELKIKYDIVLEEYRKAENEYDRADFEFSEEVSEVPEVKQLKDKVNEAESTYDQIHVKFLDALEEKSPETRQLFGDGWFSLNEDGAARLKEYHRKVEELLAQYPELRLINNEVLVARNRLDRLQSEHSRAIRELEEKSSQLQSLQRKYEEAKKKRDEARNEIRIAGNNLFRVKRDLRELAEQSSEFQQLKNEIQRTKAIVEIDAFEKDQYLHLLSQIAAWHTVHTIWEEYKDNRQQLLEEHFPEMMEPLEEELIRSWSRYHSAKRRLPEQSPELGQLENEYDKAWISFITISSQLVKKSPELRHLSLNSSRKFIEEFTRACALAPDLPEPVIGLIDVIHTDIVYLEFGIDLVDIHSVCNGFESEERSG